MTTGARDSYLYLAAGVLVVVAVIAYLVVWRLERDEVRCYPVQGGQVCESEGTDFRCMPTATGPVLLWTDRRSGERKGAPADCMRQEMGQ